MFEREFRETVEEEFCGFIHNRENVTTDRATMPS